LTAAGKLEVRVGQAGKLRGKQAAIKMRRGVGEAKSEEGEKNKTSEWSDRNAGFGIAFH